MGQPKFHTFECCVLVRGEPVPATAIAINANGDRVFVRFTKSGNTGWVEIDRLVEREQ